MQSRYDTLITGIFTTGCIFLLASPATLAILGATTGLLMVKTSKYLTLKALTATNAIIWSSYCITIGAYTNIVILIGVLLTTAHYFKSARQENLL